MVSTDIYHSVEVIGFNSSRNDNGVVGKLFIKLSENTNEKKLNVCQPVDRRSGDLLLR
jgi:hypothetical protein